MARTVTREELRDRVRQRANVVSDNHVTDDELNDLINECITENWDLLVSCAPPDFYASTTTISVSSGTSAYSLPSDFYRLRAVQVQEGNDEYRPIGPIQDAEIQRYRTPDATSTVRMRYIHTAPLLTSDASTFDGVNGWGELVVMNAAIDVMNKRRQDPTMLMAKRDRFVERIRLNVTRDAGEPARIRRASQRNADRFRIYNNTIDGYILRAGNLELYRYAGLWAT
jgi:hypothetical protein